MRQLYSLEVSGTATELLSSRTDPFDQRLILRPKHARHVFFAHFPIALFTSAAVLISLLTEETCHAWQRPPTQFND